MFMDIFFLGRFVDLCQGSRTPTCLSITKFLYFLETMKEICNTAKLCTLADYLNYGLYILDHRLEIFLDLLKVFTLLRDF